LSLPRICATHGARPKKATYGVGLDERCLHTLHVDLEAALLLHLSSISIISPMPLVPVGIGCTPSTRSAVRLCNRTTKPCSPPPAKGTAAELAARFGMTFAPNHLGTSLAGIARRIERYAFPLSFCKLINNNFLHQT